MLINNASKISSGFDLDLALDLDQAQQKHRRPPSGRRPRSAPQSILNKKKQQSCKGNTARSIHVKSKAANDNSVHSKNEYLESPDVEDVLSGAIRHVLEYVTKSQDILPELLMHFKGNGDNDLIDNQETEAACASEMDVALELKSILTLLVAKLLQERPQERELIQSHLASMVEDMIKKKHPRESSFAATIEALRNAKINEDWDHALTAAPLENLSSKQVSDTKNIVILVLGKGPCGKSTLIATLKGKKHPKCKPTMGFRPSSMKYKEDITIKFHDIGGSDGIRGIWHHYYQSANGIVYMLDSSCSPSEFDESLQVARDSLHHEDMQGKPLLVIRNKVDINADQKCSDIKTKMGLSSWDSPVKVVDMTLNGRQNRGDHDQDGVDRCIEWLIQATLATDTNEKTY